MYLDFFKLRENPFSLTPDTQFFLNRQTHREALNTVLLALHYGEGFIKIVGEVGTGKTLLSRILLSHLNKGRFVSAYVPNPWLSPEELKAYVALEIGVENSRTLATHELTTAIYRRLLQLARRRKKVVLVIDEAQAMPRETVESLRLLSNLETEKHKLLQIVLLGQPELDDLLNRKDLRQLKQRIVFSEYLKPFDAAGVRTYVAHRLSASSIDNAALFSGGACRLLASASGGVPRLINILAHKAMLCAYGRGHRRVAAWHVAQAVGDTPECRKVGKLWGLLWRTPGRCFLPGAAGGAS